MMTAVGQPSGSRLALHGAARPADSCFFLRERYGDKEPLHCNRCRSLLISRVGEGGAATEAAAFTIG